VQSLTAIIICHSVNTISARELQWAPLERDLPLTSQIFDCIVANSQRFSACQKELASLFLRAANVDLTQFLDEQFNDKFAIGDFANDNIDAILIFIGQLCAQRGHVFDDRFSEHVHRLCDKVINQSLSSVTRTDPKGARTSWTSNLERDDQMLAEDAIVLPMEPFETSDVKQDLISLPIAWDTFPTENPSALLLNTVGRIDYSIFPLIRAISAFPYSSPTYQVLNKVVLSLFSPNAVLSAVSLRALQRLCHVQQDGQVVKALVTLNAETPEEFYILGYSLLMVGNSCVQARLKLGDGIG
jgi:hypothetical protein